MWLPAEAQVATDAEPQPRPSRNEKNRSKVFASAVGREKHTTTRYFLCYALTNRAVRLNVELQTGSLEEEELLKKSSRLQVVIFCLADQGSYSLSIK